MYKSLTFGVSAAYTGVAGALSAVAIAYVAPDSFNIFLSITLLIGIVVGGLASISGAIYGALFIQFVPNWAQDISKAAPWAIFGVFLILFMYFMPYGIAGAVRRIAARARAAAGRERRMPYLSSSQQRVKEETMTKPRLIALPLWRSA